MARPALRVPRLSHRLSHTARPALLTQSISQTLLYRSRVIKTRVRHVPRLGWVLGGLVVGLLAVRLLLTAVDGSTAPTPPGGSAPVATGKGPGDAVSLPSFTAWLTTQARGFGLAELTAEPPVSSVSTEESKLVSTATPPSTLTPTNTPSRKLMVTPVRTTRPMLTQVAAGQSMTQPRGTARAVPTETLAPTGFEPKGLFELISPGPVHQGEKLGVVYEWRGPGEAQWFEIYLAVASSGSCDEGPLLYSHLLDGAPWNINYYLGPWYAGAEDSQIVASPPLPDRFRVCVVAKNGDEDRVQEEFFFEWLP